MYSIGIDVGSFSLKVAKIRSHARGFDLIHFAEYPLSQDPTKDNKIEILEALRDIMGRLFEDGTQIVVGAHMFDVAWRRKEFPFRERHKILKSLPFELEDDIPFTSESSVYDAKITHYTGNSSHVIAFACPRDHLVEIVKRFSDAMVEPTIVSVDGIALANLIETWREAPWEYSAAQDITTTTDVDVAINVGHRHTTIVVIKDGYTLDMRHIDWGGKDIADTLAQRYSMHPLEALKELRKRAFILTNNEGATKEQVALSEVIKQSIEGFAQKLNLALLDIKTQYNVQFRQGILTGGVAQLRNFGPYLTQKIDFATNRLARLEMFPQIDFGASPNNEIAALTAIGLAIEGVRRAKNPAINLLKGDFAKQSQSLRQFWEKWSHALKVATAAFVLFFVWGVMRDNFATSALDVASSNLRDHAKELGGKFNEKNVRAYIKDQDQKVKLKEMVEGLQNINSSLDALKKISALAPSKSLGGLNVFNFTVNGDFVSITGEAAKVEILNELQKSLKTAAKDGQVKSGQNPPAAHAGYKPFSYNIKFERKPSGAQ